MKYRDLIELMEKQGWEHVSTSGSHRIYRHPERAGMVVVPLHSSGNDFEGSAVRHKEAGGYPSMTNNSLVLCERGEDGTISAWVPELQPGAVISTGKDYEEARTLISEVIALYLEEMRSSGQPIAPSRVRYEVVEVTS